jgi:hypothetical protein
MRPASEPSHLRCVVCGDRIGVYEKFIRTDATPKDETSWLELRAAGVIPTEVRAVHPACRFAVAA